MNTLHLQMLYRQLLDQQAAPPTILNSGAKSPLTAFVQLVPFLDQTNTIHSIKSSPSLFHFIDSNQAYAKFHYNAALKTNGNLFHGPKVKKNLEFRLHLEFNI